jgi:hypothetical protein
MYRAQLERVLNGMRYTCTRVWRPATSRGHSVASTTAASQRTHNDPFESAWARCLSARSREADVRTVRYVAQLRFGGRENLAWHALAARPVGCTATPA